MYVLGMRLSCNFVNVYTIAYPIQYTSTHVHARIPNGHPRDDPRVEVGEDVRVGVDVCVGAVECPLNTRRDRSDCSDIRQRVAMRVKLNFWR